MSKGRNCGIETFSRCLLHDDPLISLYVSIGSEVLVLCSRIEEASC
jgi:hypothetical protein